MESSQSKILQSLMDAVSRTDIEELRKSLPPNKKLTEGRQYLVRKRKRKAPYWEYYIEYVDDGKLRVECKFCLANFAADGNLNGSKNIKNHSEKCLVNPVNKKKGKGTQAELFFGQGEGDKDNEEGETKLKYGSGTVSLKEVRDALTYMIIVDELPFRFVEKAGFKYLMGVACPRFNIPSRTTIARDCLQLYHNEKTKLKAIHKGEAIGKVVEACLEFWGIEDKLFSVIVDNVCSNDVVCAHLKRMIQRMGCVGDGKYLHVRCIAHIINLIVWDGIKEHGVCIDRVRNAFKYVKNSPARIQRFKDLVQKLNIDCKSSLSFDVPTRWNSTYTMLDTALKFQRVFSGISLPNGDGLKENEKPPELDDWKNVEKLIVFLRGFYLLTRRIFGSLYVTSNRGMFEIAAVYNMLNKWEESLDENFKAMALQ
uniref:Uncharacterized protein n=1 Tax=Chenopodium quinoa TaxID=63459 RepID=A0A803MP14_CHEQI